MAINAPIQGTEADIIKIAMVQVDNYLEKKGWTDKVRLILQVHDELVYEIDKKLVKEVAPEIKKIMEGTIPLKETAGITCKAEMSEGDNWGDMTHFE